MSTATEIKGGVLEVSQQGSTASEIKGGVLEGSNLPTTSAVAHLESRSDSEWNHWFPSFKLPILHLDPSNIHQISDTVASDLELPKMYTILSSPHESDSFSRNMILEHAKTFTSDTNFLTETQTVIKQIGNVVQPTDQPVNCADYINMWQDVKECEFFMEKHGFMDWEMLDWLNYSEDFLWGTSIINLSSPLASLILPILLFLLPFLLLKFRGVDISFSCYMDTLREISKHHFIGKMLNIQSLSLENLLYIAGMGFLYGLQMYNNITSCIRYYETVKRMNNNLYATYLFVGQSCNHMSRFLNTFGNLKSYQPFLKETLKQSLVLEELREKLAKISQFRINLKKFSSLGYMLKCYYELHKDPDYDAALKYAVGFEGYVWTISGISRRSDLGFVQFGNATEMCAERYVGVVDQKEAVPNDCDLSKGIVITGVNASGKTTYLKSVAINILTSQQFGVGLYEKCVLKPYTHIHSYLNIPDTSGRDSLFQAESRRCKEILDVIRDSPETSHHFCMFDELYSGTNPEEATKSATAFLKYMAQSWPNVDFILTTHYVKVCKKLKKMKAVDGMKPFGFYQTKVNKGPSGELEYTYKLKEGISKLHGGVEILKNMNYPIEMLKLLK